MEGLHAYSTTIDLDRLSLLVTNDDYGERLARGITDARQFHEILSRISPSPVGNTSGRDPDGSGLSQV
ncbi:hypothetical protein, partial [Klebsiella pneumoniae]|uniref:hypothetical protein n=1 Tax=Klebsiella pneumoniae TaxID=573 RepID=UPI0019545F0A